jgi:hypothetical protein
LNQEESAPEFKIYIPSVTGALRQGEIISGLIQTRLQTNSVGSDEPVIDFELHPLAIVVTQDCDLEQDFKARISPKNDSLSPNNKLIPNILFCQIISAEELKQSNSLNSKLWERVKINKDERYHFFQKVIADDDAIGEGLSELGLDFKRYFTLPTEEVYARIEFDAKRRCCLLSPYLEHFSTRFAYYQFRVALPQDHLSESPNL